MSTRAEFLRSSLIKRELETTPWEALSELAKKKIINDLTLLSHSEIERRSIETFGKHDIDSRKMIKNLAEYIMVSATTLEIVDHARAALEQEYALIPEEDLETLYRLFSNDNSGENLSQRLNTLSKEV